MTRMPTLRLIGAQPQSTFTEVRHVYKIETVSMKMRTRQKICCSNHERNTKSTKPNPSALQQPGNKVINTTEQIMTTEEARKASKCPSHVLNTNPVWLKPPCPMEALVIYDIEHSLKPTDVTNHFSGYPITKLGAELWTCYGNGGTKEVQGEGSTMFRFSQSRRAGRCCLEEGQIPVLLYWKL